MTLDEFRRMQASTRSQTNVLLRRGRLKKLPCTECDTTETVEAHHPDYSDPRRVVWLCRWHHRLLHRQLGPTEELFKTRWA